MPKKKLSTYLIKDYTRFLLSTQVIEVQLNEKNIK